MLRASRVVACVWGAWVLGGLAPALVCDSVRADPSPRAVIGGGPWAEVRHPLPTARGRGGRGGEDAPGGSGGWWLGTAGMALALALVGGISLAARRLPARADAGPLQVVGRVSLSPRHSVVLLRAGDRVLIVGAGTQGPPALLGELTDPDALGRLVPRLGPLAGPESDTPGSSGRDDPIGEGR
jgi:flagellar protein FliO/FliZ